MVENRKLFYAISVLLLSCCQIITMYPHNADSESSGSSISIVNNTSTSSNNNSNAHDSNIKSNSTSIGANTDTSSSNNSEYNRANVDSSSNRNQRSYGNNDDDSEFIIAMERKLHQQSQQTMAKPNEALSTGNMGVWEAPDSSISTENVDDLIFLVEKRPINQQQPGQQLHREYVAQLPSRASGGQKQQQHHHFEIHHHLSADGNINSDSSSTSDEHSDSLTHPTFVASSASEILVAKDADDADVAGAADDLGDGELESNADAAKAPHEIELQPKNNNEEVNGAMPAAAAPVIPLDLSDFLALIPAARVKTIVAHYYRNDPEVQRAHEFMSSRVFAELNHHVIAIPEMSAFLRYLNSSGLDLVRFVTALSNLTTMATTEAAAEKGQMTTSTLETNDIEYAQKQSDTTNATPAKIAIAATTTLTTSTTSISSNIEIQTQPPSSLAMASNGYVYIPPTVEEPAASSSPSLQPAIATTSSTEISATIDMETSTTKEQLNGLHGLVDSILDVLPQDQILATFFDKLESSEQFSKLVDNIGSPEFSKILNNLQGGFETV